MLILTRRPAETIYISVPGMPAITVTVLGVVGNQVRFGIEAPRSIGIDRAEIYERKQRGAENTGDDTQAHPSREMTPRKCGQCDDPNCPHPNSDAYHSNRARLGY